MKKLSKRKPELSVIILSFNTLNLLRGCLDSLKKLSNEVCFEVIVVDNNSTDGSVKMLENEFSWVNLIKNSSNIGFAAGNNRARGAARGKYILFLNSDTKVPSGTLKATIKKISSDDGIGALTCKTLLPSEELDKDVRRSFITPWIGLTHLILKLDRIFPRSRLFARYWYGYISEDEVHEVDVIQGAFFLARKTILDKLGWFSEEYFLDGEDIDLCYRIKKLGFKIIYYPKVKIIHHKGASKGKAERENKKEVPLADRLKFRTSGVDSMAIFYKKHMWEKYPLILNLLVITGIWYMKTVRVIKTLLFG